MGVFWLLIFLLTILVGFVDVILLVLSLFIKKLKTKRKLLLAIWGISFVLFWVSAFLCGAKIEEKEENSSTEVVQDDNLENETELPEPSEIEENIGKQEEPEVPKESDPEVPEVEEEKEDSVEEIIYEYDVLQKLFMEITVDTTPQELETLIAENNLFYTIGEYNQSGLNGAAHQYVIAYTEGASQQKYADSGDYLEVSFDNGNGDKLKFAHYVKADSLGYTAFFYNYGVWWKFDVTNAEDYSGYYIIDSFGDNKGIVLKYTNGNERETNYYKYNSAEEVINKILERNME